MVGRVPRALVARITLVALTCSGCAGDIPREIALAAARAAPSRQAEHAPSRVGIAPSPSAAKTTAGLAAAQPGPRLRVAVVSDLNGRYGSRTYGDAVHRAVARIRALAPDLVLSTGDMVAGQRSGLDYAGMWESFHAAVSDELAAARIPFAVTPGNHDASALPLYARERAEYIEQWLPRRPDLAFQDDSAYPLRYSFVHGPALFVALDATTVGPLDDEQMRWLDEQLTRGEHHPVKIVFGHVPLYPFAEGRRADHIGDPSLEALLLEHEVSLFLSGHHHAYFPGRRGTLRLVSTACLGSGARPLLGTRERSDRSILLFEVTEDGVHELDAYGGPSFDRRIDRATLPAHVGLPGMRIDRDDLPSSAGS